MEFEIKKTCHNCACVSACKYVQDASDLFSSNKFYGMFQYLEWNHLVKNFKDTSARMCMHYRRTFQDGIVDIENVPLQIMELSSKDYLKSEGRDISSWTSGRNSRAKDLVFTLKDKTEITAIEIAKNITLKLV